MAEDYLYGIRIIRPSPTDDGGVGVVGLVREGEEDLGGGLLRSLEISFSASLVGRLFTYCISLGSSRYLLKKGEAAMAVNNQGIRGISAPPPPLHNWQGGGQDYHRGRSNYILLLLDIEINDYENRQRR